MAETTNFTLLQTTEGYVGDVTGNLVGDTTGTHTGDVKTSSIQDLQGTEQIGVSASGINVVSDLTVGGNLTVLGGETILDVQKLEVEDYNIVIGKNNETSGVLNGSGITLHGGTGTDITFQYGSNGYMYLSNKLQVVEEVKTQTITADDADITELRAHLTGDVLGNVSGQVSDISNHSTTDLTEGNNLYWTPVRSDARIALQTGANLDLSQKTTSELSEGVNLYYTEARVDANIASKTTNDLAEGSNLYFTDERVRANRLDQMAVPTSDLDLNGQKLTNLAEPVANDDAATKYFVLQKVAEKDSLSELSGTTDDLVEGTTNLFLTPNAQQINGAKTFNGTVIMGQSLIVPTPTSGTQAVNKDYLDNAIANIDELSELLGSTDDVQEGSTNLYYTDARVHAAISAGTGVTYDGSGEFSIGQSVATSDNVTFGQVYVRTGTGVGVDLHSQSNNASLRFHTSAGQTGIISTTSGNAPVQVYASLLWARAINGGTGNFMADGDVTVGGDLSVTGTISSPTITALEAQLSGDTTALQAELDATQAGAGLNTDGTYTANTGANYIASSSSLQDADNDLDTALKAEEASRQAADSTLQSNIDAEEASRIAGDATLQSNIDTEEAARIAGDASTLSSANSYTDTAVANLVDSAPATLDTLNEIAAALGDDPNLSVTLTNQIAGVQTNLDAEIATTDAEITALQATDSAEQTARIAADNTLQSNIDSEAATRSSADTTLQSNIDTVSANLATEISATDAEITALQAADVTLQSNIDSEASTRASADTTLQSNIDSEAATRASADTTLQSNIDTVAADLASEISTTNGEITALQAEVDAIETGAGLSASGAYVANGSANYISAASSLADADNKLDAALKAEETSRTSADSTLQSNIDTVASDLASEITTTDSEITALQSADTTLQSNIDAVASDLSTEESTRAAADTTLQSNIDSEASTRASADATLQGNINIVAANLATEIAATDAEVSALQSADTAEATARAAADTTLQSNIDSEEAARILADNILQSNIDTEEAARIAGDAATLSSAQSYTDTAVSNLVDSAPGALDTLNELAAALADDPNFATTITNQIAAVQSDVDQNEADADAAIAALQADVDQNEADADAAIAALQADVDQNEADADAAIALKADIASPTFTGVVSAPTVDISGELTTGDITIDAGGDDAKLTFVLETNGNADKGGIVWTRDSGGADIGAIKYVRSQDSIHFYTNGTTTADVTINAAGKLIANNGIEGSLTGTVSDISNHDTDALTEGTSNLYYTDARVGTYIGTQTTDVLSEGASNLYYTDGRSRSAISVSGDLSYNSSTGVISFTERTDAQVNGLADARIAAASINDLSDVTVSGVATTGDLLRYNKSTGIWENVEIVGTTNIEVEHTAGTTTIKHGTSHISKTYDNADNGTSTNDIPLNRAEVILDVAGTATNDVYLNIAAGTEGQEIILVLDTAYSSIYNIYLNDSGAASNATNMYGTFSLGDYNRVAVLRYCSSIGLWTLVGGDAYVTY